MHTRALRRRECGGVRGTPGLRACDFARACSEALELSKRVDVRSAHAPSDERGRGRRARRRSPVSALAIDQAQQRLLLAGAADGCVSAYNVTCASEADRDEIDTFGFENTIGSDGSGDARSTTHRPLFVLPSAHGRSVCGATWYPMDSGLFVTGSADCTVGVWDASVPSAGAVARLDFSAEVRCVAMSPVATTHALVAVATDEAGSSAALRLADLSSGSFAHAFAGHTGGVRCAAWLPRSEHELASGGADGGIRVWDVRRPGALALLDMHNDADAALAGEMGAVGGVAFAGRTQAWRARADRAEGGERGETGWAAAGAAAAPKAQLARAHARAVTALCASPDGLWLLSTGGDASLRLWDLWSGRHAHVHYEGAEAHSSASGSLALSADGRTVYGCGGGSIKCWDVFRGRAPKARLCAHIDGASVLAAHPSMPGLYSGGSDGEICAFEPELEPMHQGGADGSDWGFDAALGGGEEQRDQWSDEDLY